MSPIRMFLACAVTTVALLGAAVPSSASTVAGQTMPNLVGKTVFQAEGALPFGTSITLVDAKGLHRKVVWPANWQVCTQDPAPGAALKPDTKVTLTVVKLQEKC